MFIHSWFDKDVSLSFSESGYRHYYDPCLCSNGSFPWILAKIHGEEPLEQKQGHTHKTIPQLN